MIRLADAVPLPGEARSMIRLEVYGDAATMASVAQLLDESEA